MKRHVALKIVKSDPHFCKSALEEIELLEQAQTAGNGSHQHVAQLLHHFWHDAGAAGGGGKHVCMVFEVLGESLLSLMKRFNYRGLPVNMVKRITRQVLDGLAFLHDTCGIVHTDIKPENILICIPDVEDYLEKQKRPSQPRRFSSSSTLLLDSPATTPVSDSSGRRLVKRKMKRQQKRTEDPPLGGKQKR